MKSASTRMGVDIGGTFTDVVLEVGQEQFSTKVLTTYAAPENAITEGIRQVCAIASIAMSEYGMSQTEVDQLLVAAKSGEAVQ